MAQIIVQQIEGNQYPNDIGPRSDPDGANYPNLSHPGTRMGPNLVFQWWFRAGLGRGLTRNGYDFESGELFSLVSVHFAYHSLPSFRAKCVFDVCVCDVSAIKDVQVGIQIQTLDLTREELLMTGKRRG
jgi:hypothetical protein